MREMSVFRSRHNIYGIGSWGLTKQQRQGRSKEFNYFLLIITIIVNCFILEMMVVRFFCVDNQS